MRFDLAMMTKRATNRRRSSITLRPIQPTATMAGDLYRAGYKPIIEAWRRAVEQIGARYEAALPLTDAIHDSIFDLESILAAVEGELQRIVIAITPSLREWATRAEAWHRGKWRAATLTATGIDLKTLLGGSDVSDDVGAFVARNVRLIRSVSDEARGRVSDIVLRGYQARAPLRQVAKEMDEAVELGRKRSLRIASDQSSKMAARLDQARQEQAGLDSYTWRHSYKLHPRLPHVARNGKVFKWAEPPEDGHPGTQPFCGCRAQAYIDLS